jgi:hypothetical protein
VRPKDAIFARKLAWRLQRERLAEFRLDFDPNFNPD